MTLIFDSKILSQQEFTYEKELQGCLSTQPALLKSEQEDDIIFVHRELKLPSAGFLDIFCIDSSGTPIAVEVKLAKNGQSRREVVAQIFDYVSDLSSITIDELDDLVEGTIYDCLSGQDTDQNLWRTCAANLRAGMIKVVIAVDEANEDLVRIVRYINEHSDLDVRLLTISKYQDGKIFVPNILVSGNSDNSLRAKISFRKDCSPRFEAVITHYDTNASKELQTRGKAKNYRALGPASWPRSLHYEFCENGQSIGVELHIEKEGLEPVSEYLITLEKHRIQGQPVEWSSKWSKGGRIRVLFSNDFEVGTIAKAMQDLIDLTKDNVSALLA
ncbi:TPA: hypothetical protein I7750_19705 [Vibrio vulnificus]|nr:hypothetical protein [Vibrio vulnificus]EHY0959085.1 hypothetical protein [Vibrio vulnificus]EHZ2848481.1 hypothetical protein [Vibrio vulnificus]EIA0806667.1 hypothetical protein [Vibrio vulnificus]EIT7146156.1 hypothetical protein [Vibrio vulnificus]